MYVLFMLGFMYIYIYTFYELPYAMCTAPKSNAIQRNRSEKNPFDCEVPFFFVGTISKQLIELSNELSSLQAVVLTLE